MHRINMTLVWFLVFTIVSSGLAYKIVLSGYNTYGLSHSESYGSTKSSSKDDHADLIQVSSPKSNAVVKSPLVVKGEARGNWYFEASFPVRLLDADGQELAIAPAQAQGEWMTTDFVPFEVTLNFSKPATTTGTLILQKDNPSGLPEHDDSISIPVKFQ